MTNTQIYLPDGQQVWLPVAPRTWADEATGQRGDALRAPLVTRDVGGAVAWLRQRPLFQGIQTASQSIPSAAFTPIGGLSELIDNWSGHSDSSNAGRWYAPNTGTTTSGGDWYLCSGYVPFNSSAAGSIFIAGLRINGGGTVQEGGRIPSGTGHPVTTMVADLVQLYQNDYVELVGYQNTGSSVSTVVSSKSPALTVRWVAPDQASPDVVSGVALPPVPHTWTGSDVWTGSATGTNKVPMNTECRDPIRFLLNPPVARVTASGTSQTIPSGSGTWTSVAFTTASIDNYGGWSSGLNGSRYTCQRAGLYFVAGFVNVIEAGTNAGYRAVRLLVNGAVAYPGWSSLPQSSGSTGTGLYATGRVRLNVGDYVEVQMQQTQGSALSLYSNAGNASRLIALWTAR